ncbi:pilus assembly protein N-terminal domain-containing protein [Dysgonomonas sp. Marseille-P4361]|uniref:pilus assembly protein N-terminal domain-containing protein n=1 Tax=Dysgonomonas sp. Marseille-P4361 TaxID=2161820 RepID=UPI00135B81DE|nr:pilus assembly protein N-terminal domain-containing protein [Dysgonomonas sp. Marseille-P4361]
MKKSKLLLTLLMATLFVGFTSCDNDDDEINLKVEQNEVNIEVGEKAVVKITEGNGDYKAIVTDEEVATAETKESEIIISALAEGSTTVTVTDKEGKSATITVNVVGIVGTWNLDETKLAVEVEANEETAEKIKTELASNNFKSIELNDDKTFKMTKEGEEGTENTVSGTYIYVDKILTLAITEEGQEAETISMTITEVTKTSIKLNYDQTESFQTKYPEGEVTKALVTLELTAAASQE